MTEFADPMLPGMGADVSGGDAAGQVRWLVAKGGVPRAGAGTPRAAASHSLSGSRLRSVEPVGTRSGLSRLGPAQPVGGESGVGP